MTLSSPVAAFKSLKTLNQIISCQTLNFILLYSLSSFFHVAPIHQLNKLVAMGHFSAGLRIEQFAATGVGLLAFFNKESSTVTEPIRSEDRSDMFYSDLDTAVSSHVCCPDWKLSVSHSSGNRLRLDCTSLARALLPCLALNPLKANYNPIAVITFPKMTMEPVVEGGREQDKLWFSLSVSSSPALNSPSAASLLSKLVAAEAIDIITVLATGRWKVLTDEFLLWKNET